MNSLICSSSSKLCLIIDAVILSKEILWKGCDNHAYLRHEIMQSRKDLRRFLSFECLHLCQVETSFLFVQLMLKISKLYLFSLQFLLFSDKLLDRRSVFVLLHAESERKYIDR